MALEHLLITLLQVPGLGHRKIRQLLRHFPQLQAYEDLEHTDLKSVEGFSPVLSERILAQSPDPAWRILDSLHRIGGGVLHIDHPAYPVLLKEIYDAPVVLYYRGMVEVLAHDFLAVVGTRRPTPYGRTQAQHLTDELVASGLGIISGFARGIDSLAHRQTLINGGTTVAVLGCGVDVVYPSENRELYNEMVDKGLLVSEYPLGTSPDGHHFPQRNRIISGMGIGVLVIEAGEKSGALITGNLAIREHNREVFAVPGPLGQPQSTGCHRLIQHGAKLVTSVEDILEELQPPYNASPGEQLALISDQLPAEEKAILEHLDNDPVHIDELAERMSMDISILLIQLTQMEMKGLVAQTAGKRFVRGR